MSSEIYLIKGDNRSQAISQLLEQFSLKQFKNKNIAIKANYNSADPYPAQTHPETLKTLVKSLQNAGSKEIVLAERSGMGDTREVLEKGGIINLAKKLQFKIEVLNDLPFSGWLHFDIEGSHWDRGFLFARMFIDADCIVQTCCLKTHKFGGHFTLSLKNSVGMVARYNPQDGYDYMGELHGSPHQREMIAEINTAYEPQLILMDGVDAFIQGGPAVGEKVNPKMLLAATDRVALDAVGVAILRHYRTTEEVEAGSIFQQEQLARAIDLGLGARSLKDIRLIPLDDYSERFSEEIVTQFAK
ncbi:MAG: DUF362 domain-containing protein [Candidatus Thorarchaeota archaeon]